MRRSLVARPIARTLRSRLGRGLAYALAAIVVPLLVGVGGAGARIATLAAAGVNPPPYAGPLPEPPAHDPTRRTAVVIAANSGTEGTDFLAPYEVLGASGAFNLYAVAPERRITHLFSGNPLLRGVDFVPHYSFAQYDQAIGAAPDLIVIPFMPEQDAPEYGSIVDWIRSHARPDTILLAICAGSFNLADTGLLDGRTVTTHHNYFARFAERHPQVRTVRGVRYVEDGNIISSAGITAGVDSTLYTLKRMLGREEAVTVAQRLGYPYAAFIDDPAYALPVPQGPGIYPNAYRAGTTRIGVALYPGISEIALGSVTDTYPLSLIDAVETLAPERAVVVSRHGLALVPRWSFADAPRLDRLIIPGATVEAATRQGFTAWAAGRGGPEAELIHSAGGYPYDTTLSDIARRSGSAVAAATVYGMEYPSGGSPVPAPAYPPDLLARPFLLALAGLGLAYAINRRLARRGVRLRAASVSAL